VVIHAVAARDRKKAEAYAKKHRIPVVLDSYQAILDSPDIDAVYIPLPNGLHFEWAVKALDKGKHVLLEKPYVSNAEEAAMLLDHSAALQKGPEGGKGGGPVILEAFHYRFQPAWLLFVSLLRPADVAHAEASMLIPDIFPPDDIRFRYDIAGGALLDLTYSLSVVRGILQTEPLECTACETATMPEPYDTRCEYRYDASWAFPNGATARTRGNLRTGWWDSLKGLGDLARAKAVHKPTVVADSSLAEKGEEKVVTRTVTMINFLMAALWHRIDVEDEFVVRKKDTGEVTRRWVVKESRKAYTFSETGIEGLKERASEPHWLTYKHQLDAFVDRVRGREGTGAWIDGEDSVRQMKMVDMAYGKAGLLLRGTSKFRTGAGE